MKAQFSLAWVRRFLTLGVFGTIFFMAFINCGRGFNIAGPSDFASSGPQGTSSPELGSEDPLKPDIDPAGIFDGRGNVNADAYRKMASEYGTASMIAFRFGKNSNAYNPGGVLAPTAYQRPTKTYVNASNPVENMFYNLGTPKVDSGDYSSNEAQVAYVTDPAVSDSKPGIDRISTVYMAHGVFSGVPQIYWNYKGWGADSLGHPDQHFIYRYMTDIGKANFNASGGMPSNPVDVTRSYGAGEAAGQSLIVFQNGMISAGGTATASGTDIYTKFFPSTLVPTAATVTNNGEFALITLWDTQNLKGKVAVLSLGGYRPSGSFWNYEFSELYPGFRNYSLWNFVKLLGYVDLPDNMIAPTAIEAVGDQMIGNGLGWLPGTRNPGQYPLTIQSNWACFQLGTECLYDQKGFALVSSRYEKKVAVIDLNPLFKKVKNGMFADWNTFRANVANTGMGASQWPQTFVMDPTQIPQVVKTISFNKQVTAISASLMRDNKGLIATEDGAVHIYDMDGLQTGGMGKDIKETSSFQVGRNVTRIAHMKHGACCGDGGEVRYQYVIVSRGDQRVDWLDLKTNKIIRTLRDSRFVDIISAEDNNNHGTVSDLLSIVDYGAKKVRGYRYGPIIFVTDGGMRYDMGEDGKAEFEYTGDYGTPTGPFCISIENVT